MFLDYVTLPIMSHTIYTYHMLLYLFPQLSTLMLRYEHSLVIISILYLHIPSCDLSSLGTQYDLVVNPDAEL
jgi:hypothetical protein